MDARWSKIFWFKKKPTVRITTPSRHKNIIKIMKKPELNLEITLVVQLHCIVWFKVAFSWNWISSWRVSASPALVLVVYTSSRGVTPSPNVTWCKGSSPEVPSKWPSNLIFEVAQSIPSYSNLQNQIHYPLVIHLFGLRSSNQWKWDFQNASWVSFEEMALPGEQAKTSPVP